MFVPDPYKEEYYNEALEIWICQSCYDEAIKELL
jgi:hypothetical protein